MAIRIQMIGNVFGRLTVLSKADKVGRSPNVYWNTVCICGNTSVVRGDSMRDGSIKSCGCLKMESAMRDEGLSLDRINNNGNYELANCRWATINEQANNQRHNRGKERRLVEYR